MEAETEKRIKELMPAGSLNTDTRLVLVNAIYFRADWLDQVDATDTLDGTFHLLDGSETETALMHKYLGQVAFFTGAGLKAVELPCAGGTAVMDLLVPDSGGYESFEAAFTEETLDTAVKGMRPAALELVLPRYEFSSAMDLGTALTSMGMTDAFDPDRADFSGIAGDPNLYVGEALHQAFVAVDEQGTEAAAATAVVMGPTSAMMPQEQLIIDRPLIFVIRDTASGQILFIGRVLNPAP